MKPNCQHSRRARASFAFNVGLYQIHERSKGFRTCTARGFTLACFSCSKGWKDLKLSLTSVLPSRGRGGLGSEALHPRYANQFYIPSVCILLVVPILFASGQSASSAPSTGGSYTRLSGVVFDSSAGVPLENALVQVVSRRDPSRILSVRSDNHGAFEFDSLQSGEYLIGFLHARLDSLFLAPGARLIAIPAESKRLITLFVPSVRTLAEKFCGQQVDRSDVRVAGALMLGTVRETSLHGALSRGMRASNDGDTFGGVRASWFELFINEKKLQRSKTSSVATTNGSGLSYSAVSPPVRALMRNLARGRFIWHH